MRLSDISARKCKLQCGNIVLFFELSFVALLIRFGLINLQSTIGRAHRKSNARARIRVRTFACVKRFFTQLRIFLDMRTKVHIPFSSAHVPTLSIIITIIILCFFTLFLVSARSYASRIQIIAMNSNTKRRENVTHTLLLRRIYVHMYIFWYSVFHLYLFSTAFLLLLLLTFHLSFCWTLCAFVVVGRYIYIHFIVCGLKKSDEIDWYTIVRIYTYSTKT